MDEEIKMVIREIVEASGATLEGGSDRRVYTERILLDHKFEIGHRTTGKIVIIPDGIGS